VRRVIVALILPAVIIGAWEVSASVGVVSRVFFPPPSRLAVALGDMTVSGRLWDNLAPTLLTVLIGFIIGGIAGFVVGLSLGSSPRLRAIFEPSMSAVYSIPKIALLPIFLAVFGVGPEAVVALVATSTFFYVWVYTMGAALRVPDSYLVAGRVFRASRSQVFWSIYAPSTLPEAFAGLRVGITVALLVTLTSEYVLGSRGLGYLIFGSRALGSYSESYVGIVLAGALGLVLQMLVVYLGKLLMPWHETRLISRHAGV
jgi:sulfonate transport system permease protein